MFFYHGFSKFIVATSVSIQTDILLTDPEHRPTEIGVGHDGARAVVRTGGRARRRGLEVAAEHPRRGRDITGTAIIWGITVHLAPAILITIIKIAGITKCIAGSECIRITCSP